MRGGSADACSRPITGEHLRARRITGFDPEVKSVTLCVKLIKIGAKVVSHERYVTFQMAEVAVPRHLFREKLRLIDGLRRPSLTTG